MYEEQVAELLGVQGQVNKNLHEDRQGGCRSRDFLGEEVFRFFVALGGGWCFLEGRGCIWGGGGKEQAGQGGIRQRGRSRVGEWGGFL